MSTGAVEMNEAQAYTDRFGNTWSVRTERARGRGRYFVFTCGDIRLLSGQDADAEHTGADLKDLFCEAERVIELEDELWYVGYRSRVNARGARTQGGVCTRFRSESGRVGYSKTMLLFRQMPEAELRRHLKRSQTVTA